jgi:hypothetical protein
MMLWGVGQWAGPQWRASSSRRKRSGARRFSQEMLTLEASKLAGDYRTQESHILNFNTGSCQETSAHIPEMWI